MYFIELKYKHGENAVVASVRAILIYTKRLWKIKKKNLNLILKLKTFGKGISCNPNHLAESEECSLCSVAKLQKLML